MAAGAAKWTAAIGAGQTTPAGNTVRGDEATVQTATAATTSDDQRRTTGTNHEAPATTPPPIPFPPAPPTAICRISPAVKLKLPPISAPVRLRRLYHDR